MDERPMVSPEDLANRLGVPIATIYRWNLTGDGPRRYRLGRHVRYDAAEVDEWLASRAERPQS